MPKGTGTAWESKAELAAGAQWTKRPGNTAECTARAGCWTGFEVQVIDVKRLSHTMLLTRSLKALLVVATECSPGELRNHACKSQTRAAFSAQAMFDVAVSFFFVLFFGHEGWLC